MRIPSRRVTVASVCVLLCVLALSGLPAASRAAPNAPVGPIPRLFLPFVATAPKIAVTSMRFVAGMPQPSAILVVNADGSNVVDTIQNVIAEDAPSWAPDGARIAFTRGTSITTTAIFTASLSGRIQVNVSGAAGARDSEPAWSPDGAKIAFMSDRDRSQGLYIMDADGANPQALTSLRGFATDYSPSWAPDGSAILFERSADRRDLFTIKPDGSGLVRLTEGSVRDQNTGGDWSPDSKRIAYSGSATGLSRSAILVVNADGTGRVQLTSTADIDSGAQWSPDGSRIVFMRTTTYDSDIYVMNADGSGQVNLTNTPSYWEEAPAWSPDGGKIAFVRLLNGQGRIGRGAVYLMNTDGSHQTQLTNPTAESNDSRPVWAP